MSKRHDDFVFRYAGIASVVMTLTPLLFAAQDAGHRLNGTAVMSGAPKGFVVDGDSITDGYGVSPTYPDNLAAMTGTSVINLGVSGRTLTEMTETFDSRGVADFHDARTNGTLVILGGINDILHDAKTTPETLRHLLREYCRKARVAGFRVIVVTLLPVRGLPPQREAIRIAHNDWIRTNWPTFADALADAELAPELSVPSDRQFYSDGLHLTAGGLRVLAGVIKNASFPSDPSECIIC